jgi:hypothetical protein
MGFPPVMHKMNFDAVTYQPGGSRVKVLNRRLRVNGSVVSAELENEAVLLNVETGIYFGIDAVGTEIWKLLEEGATEDEIVARLLEEYDVEAAELRTDVIEFLDVLQKNGLAQAD